MTKQKQEKVDFLTMLLIICLAGWFIISFAKSLNSLSTSPNCYQRTTYQSNANRNVEFVRTQDIDCKLLD